MADKPHVVLYGKPGCHLCEIVEQTIQHVGRSHEFDFEKRNIEENPDDFERYKHDIPVVTVNGKQVAKHQLTADALIDAISSAG